MDGKHVVVTGAASGLGLAITEGLLESGAHVTMLDVDADGLKRSATALARSEGTFSVRQCDISRADEIETAVADAVRERDSLNCLFANAGIAGGAGIYSPAGRLYDLDWSLFQRTLAVNLVGTLATVRAAACAMRPARRGSIVVTVATAGLRADSMVGYGYSASKGALANLVRQLAVDLAADGIRVNGIAPGPLPYEHRRAEPDRPSGGQGLGGYGPAGPDG